MIDEDLSDPKAPIRGNWNLYDDRNPGIDFLDKYYQNLQYIREGLKSDFHHPSKERFH